MLKRTRRYLRFSLRALFLLTTACAIWLGHLCRRAHDQRVAVDRIIELDGSVLYDFEIGEYEWQHLWDATPPGWPWLRRLVGDEYSQEVVKVQLVCLDDHNVSDVDLQLIGRLKALRTLWLYGGDFPNDSLLHLRHLRNLRCLHLVKAKVTGSDLRFLGHLQNLKELKLEFTPMGNDGLKYVGELRRLEVLDLYGTSVTSAGLSHLAGLKSLRWLALDHTKVDDSAIEHLAALGSLERLYLSGTDISGEGLLAIRSALPSCNVDGDIVDISGRAIFDTKQGLKEWHGWVLLMPSMNDRCRLKLIDLSGSRLSDEHLPALHGLGNVQMIDLRDTRVTDDGIEQLRQVLPDCKFHR